MDGEIDVERETEYRMGGVQGAAGWATLEERRNEGLVTLKAQQTQGMRRIHRLMETHSGCHKDSLKAT